MADGDSTSNELTRLERRAARERAARLAAEAIAERGLRDLYDARREADLLRAVATASNEATTIGPALRRCLTLVAEYAGAIAGHAWVSADESPFLFATGIWYGCGNSSAFAVLQAATEAQVMAIGEGLPGHVAARRAPVWIEDVHTDPTFVRNRGGARFGVGAAFGMPVFVGDSVAAVLELFFAVPMPENARILAISADIGAQIGRVIERSRASKALARAHDELQTRMDESAAARSAADSANVVKGEFLANMSHELRTPLGAVIGYADLLMDVSLTPHERLEYIRTIRRNGEHLLNVLNGVLDFSKIEAGKLDSQSQPCDVSRVIADVASLMRVRALDKDLPLEVEFATPIPQSFPCDATHLRQILLNLVGNAIKFTDRGSIRIVVRCDEPTSSAPQLLISVVDEGVGMSTEQIAGLFVPFSQVDSSMTRRFTGTGLGLAISKRLAEELGGSLSVESELDRGSTFTLTLATGPLENVPMVADLHEVAAHRPSVSADTDMSCSARVLLAEDGLDNQRIICRFLQKAGATVTVAENGRLAVDEALSATSSGAPYDVILMDMQMPVLDGYAATAELRMNGYRQPIVALTAHALASDRDRCMHAGCDDYLSKPVDRGALISIVQRWARTAPLYTTLEDGDDMLDLVEEFTTEAAERAERIRTAARELDLPTLSVLAHQFRGSATTYGFAPIGEAGGRLEDAILADASDEVIGARVEDLLELLDRVRAR